MRPRRFHGLKRPKVRQTWNKYNLYNMARPRHDPVEMGSTRRTLFQNKWIAKGLLRAYHGEHVVERKWTRLFNRRLLSVTNMDPQYLATHDGAELAAGRGSGIRKVHGTSAYILPERRVAKPYMQMTFGPMERRLDIAVFRAMFASSARQARQFCVHGAVKVNGKIMPYPAYQLNPGDMFQVEPDMVLMATGKPSPPGPSGVGDGYKSKRKPKATEAAEDADPEAVDSAEEPAAATPNPNQDPDTTDAPKPQPFDKGPAKEAILELAAQAKWMLNEKNKLKAKGKRRLRTFFHEAKALVSRLGRPQTDQKLVLQELNSMVQQLSLKEAPEVAPPPPRDGEDPAVYAKRTRAAKLKAGPYESLTFDQRLTLTNSARSGRLDYNPIDPTKPYHTPWTPRKYMAPFAHIPRYLEVNQAVCSAVYLRHPVARVGQAEVPTPYNSFANQLAYQWYLRRR